MEQDGGVQLTTSRRKGSMYLLSLLYPDRGYGRYPCVDISLCLCSFAFLSLIAEQIGYSLINYADRIKSMLIIRLRASGKRHITLN